MVEAYWDIGKSIVEQQDGYEKAEYGTRLIAELSKQMTIDFGKGFTPTNLKYMRQFYLTFPIRHALRDELSWTHYRLLMRVESEEIQKLEPANVPKDIIRDPYVLEFLGLSPNNDFYESDLEEALITHLQKFLLELGGDFLLLPDKRGLHLMDGISE